MDESAKDVTQRILDRHITYGASDYTKPGYAASSKSLNYQAGGSIQRPEIESVSVIPFTLKYNDAVGLFGKENHFIRVNLTIDRAFAFACFEPDGWECAELSSEEGTENTYQAAIIDPASDLVIEETYEPAEISGENVNSRKDAYVSIDLTNLKTGNKYIDAWLDVRLYTEDREEHPYDQMYVRLNDHFYIGFHARNTKRLPYNVECVIGQKLVSRREISDQRHIMRTVIRESY